MGISGWLLDREGGQSVATPLPKFLFISTLIFGWFSLLVFCCGTSFFSGKRGLDGILEAAADIFFCYIFFYSILTLASILLVWSNQSEEQIDPRARQTLTWVSKANFASLCR